MQNSYHCYHHGQSIDKLLPLRYYALFLLLLISTWLYASSLQLEALISIVSANGFGFELEGVTISFDTWH